MKDEDLWNKFIKKNKSKKTTIKPLKFHFCDNEKDADNCANLVIKGIKRATSSSLWWYKKNNEKIPKIGDICIITNWKENQKAIIEITEIKLIPYNKITAEFAKKEGEGDKSLKHWKKIHKLYFTKERALFNEEFDENMIIVCEHFKKLYSE